MARARNIKPGFFTNDILGELEPLARILFAGLWCHADRSGRLEDRPKKLKAEILPYDECDINGLIQCLHSAGMVLRYVVDGKNYIQILKFEKHQNPHVKEAASSIPAPDKHSASQEKHEASHADSLNPITDSLKPIPAKAVVSAKSRKTSMPSDFGNNWSPAMGTWLEGNCPSEHLKAHFDYFVGYVKANGKQYVDWEQAFQNAINGNWAKVGQPAGKNGSPQWWASDATIEAKGRELGLSPRPGENWQQFKGRINERLGLPI